MFVTKELFTGEISLHDPDTISGYGDIIDKAEEKFLKMLLGGEQYSEFYDAIIDEDSTDYEKWNKFLKGNFRYDYKGYKIQYHGAIEALKYFCYYYLLKQQSFTAGNELYKQQTSSGVVLAGVEREDKLNDAWNKGVFYFKKAAYYMDDNEDYDFNTNYTVFPNIKKSFGGITL